MDNQTLELQLNFLGADALPHTFRITDLRGDVDAEKVNAALDELAQLNAFANEAGDYYLTPVDAVLITTTTKTIVTR